MNDNGERNEKKPHKGVKTIPEIGSGIALFFAAVLLVFGIMICLKKLSGDDLFALFLDTGDILSFIAAVIFGVVMYRLEKRRDKIAEKEATATKVRARQMFDFRYIELPFHEMKQLTFTSKFAFELTLKESGIFHYFTASDNFYSVELPKFKEPRFYFWVLRLSGEGFVYNCKVTLLDNTFSSTESISIGLMSFGQICIVPLPYKLADKCGFIIEYDTIESESIKETIEFGNGLTNSFTKDNFEFCSKDEKEEKKYHPWFTCTAGKVFPLDYTNIKEFASKS